MVRKELWQNPSENPSAAIVRRSLIANLPTGTVTFLITDIEGSTLLQRLGEARAAQVFDDHRRLLRDAFAAGGGHELQDQGDGFLVAFQSARDAMQTALAVQQAIRTHPWPEAAEVRVRMGLYSGDTIRTAGGYVGLAIHRAARIGAAAYGGQIPLAIELAAARTRLLSVDQIAARLDDRFRLLTGGSRTALPRHQTLRAAIGWSYDLLSAAEQMFLRRLSVFAGGWTLEAAEAVCAGDGIEELEALDLLSRLVDKSLVVVEEGAKDDVRYRLLDTVRQYSWDRVVASSEAEVLRKWHGEFFVSLAERAGPELLRAH